MKIFVITHISPSYQLPQEYNYMLGGNFLKADEKNLGYVSHDHLSDSIALKNNYYSELSSLYQINQLIKAGLIEEDFVGLVHYRRFFTKYRISDFKLQIKKIIHQPLAFKDIENSLIRESDLKLASEKEFYLAKATKFPCSVYEQYAKAHDINELDLAIDVIKKTFPDYVCSTSTVMKRNFLYCCNMFIGHKKVIMQYCNWLFPILTQLESSINFSIKSDYQKRVFGYLSERLFNIWIEKHKESIDIKLLTVDKILGAFN